MDKTGSDLSTFKLLQPTLLTETELKEILTSRCVETELSSWSKSELVELFQRVALPLPQREYGLSRREQRLSQKQARRKKAPVRTSGAGSSKEISVQPEKKNYTTLENKSGSLERLSCPGERLKPPPDLINFKRKTIKINESSKKMIRTELDKIVIKNKPKEGYLISEVAGDATLRSGSTLRQNGRRRLGEGDAVVAASPAAGAAVSSAAVVAASSVAGAVASSAAGAVVSSVAGAAASSAAGAAASSAAGAAASSAAGVTARSAAGEAASSDAGAVASSIAGAVASSIAGAVASSVAGAVASSVAGAAASPAGNVTPISKQTKVIRLKRDLTPSDTQSQAETSTENRKETPQKKRQKIVIAW